ncbi:hypothetical protein AV944_10995 [Sphingomonas sp. LK11]|uniref:hypothetical protein n=1 Tax=Sphingomonas sp. LK11 TaxID=1390395 RepID=UPI000972CE6C|nr:hypothetical protein [Sphingomonas sp. LK11]APX66266.1 hypothetical protein AV944_10995 [Sphingomonas sp. LK11]
MTDPTEIAHVAAGLTRAQIARLDGVAELRHRGLQWASKWGSLRMNTSRATTAALVEMGLLYDVYGNADVTEKGHAVRDHILREKKNG